MPETAAVPPKWIMLLLWPFKGESCYPQIEGDLREEFQDRVSKNGIADARRWYCREIFRNLRSLAVRPSTIAAIVLPLLCIAFKLSVIDIFLFFSMTIASWLSPLTHNTTMNFLIFIFLSTVLKGLAFGMICGVFLSGHERMTRLVFAACYLGFWVIWGITYPHSFLGFYFAKTEISVALILGFRSPFRFINPFAFIEPVWILAFIWYGSTWIERLHSRKNKGLLLSA